MSISNLKNNYYYNFVGNINRTSPNEGFKYEDKIVKFLGNNKLKFLDSGEDVELDTSRLTFLNEKMISKLQEIEISSSHLVKLGFIEKNGVYEHNNGMQIYLNISNVGIKDIPLKYIGNVLLNNEDKEKFKKIWEEKINKESSRLEEKYTKYKEKVNEIQQKWKEEGVLYIDIKEQEEINSEYFAELGYLFVSVLETISPPMRTINELFERLENEGVIVENKDDIVK